MKCPILSAPTARTAFTEHFADVDCLKGKCAWWDATTGCCSILALSQVFIAIGNTLGEIANRKSINVQLAR